MWTKVFLDKGITNRTRLDYWPSLHRSIGFTKDHGSQKMVETKKRYFRTASIAIGRAALLWRIYWLLWIDWIWHAWQLVHHRAFDELFACARAVCDSASTLIPCGLQVQPLDFLYSLILYWKSCFTITSVTQLLPSGVCKQGQIDLSWPCLLRATGHWGGGWCRVGAR